MSRVLVDWWPLVLATLVYLGYLFFGLQSDHDLARASIEKDPPHPELVCEHCGYETRELSRLTSVGWQRICDACYELDARPRRAIRAIERAWEANR